MLILSLQHIPNAEDTRFHKEMLLKLEAEAKLSWGRGQRLWGRGWGQSFGLEGSFVTRL